jgi:hypothetical protein
MTNPPTLADICNYGVDVFCWCNRCSHHAVLPINMLIAQCGAATPFPAIHGRLRCQVCGTKDIHARPNWKGLGVVARHEPMEVEKPEPKRELVHDE